MNNPISKKEIAEIIIGDFLKNPTQKGRNIFADCPFCGAEMRTHKFSLNPEKGVWGCFRCHAEEENGGGVLALYSELALGMSVEQATPKEVYRNLRERISGGTTSIKKAPRVVCNPNAYKEITPAEDNVCHKAYATLLQLPCLSLTGQHAGNLRRRGLSETAIIGNKYRSFEAKRVLETYPQYRGVLSGEELGKLAKLAGKNIPRETWESRLALGEECSKKAATERVAGFFTLNGKHFANLSEGMLIPTRNLKGEIVGMQTRKDSGSLRYVTLSSADFGGVNTGVSRVHVPRGCAWKAGVPVLITEGGLKADIIKDLAKGEVMVLAVMGVNNTRELLSSVLPALKEQGVRNVKDAFDMDKVCNLNVAKALDTLTGEVHKLGLSLDHLVWDEEHAQEKACPLVLACDKAGVKPQCDYDNIYDVIHGCCLALKQAGIPLPEGTSEWRSEEKGLDDHLLSLAKRLGRR